MAGGGAAASALSSPWRSLLQRALDGNAHLKHSTFFQLATVGGGGGRPANRTVVFRGFQEQSDKIQINTDARSNKIGEIRNCPFGEICWYFTDTWEQFRISGFIDVIDGSSPDPVKLQLRERAWFGSSVKSRLQYLGPCPGLPIPNDDLVKDVHIDPSAGPVDAFCLLVLDPEKVDYLNLKSNQRLMFTRNQKEDGSNNWMGEKISP
ncbi:pyridoxine/pyridoxamine 5'-phosphate oxidase 2 isoform X1 [Oryza brachyantha]|uniref:pyridoxal 5'-phosphate synthase n=1 Tax=Oryza brachyantha TaxID=4533 RepID=J3LJ93_ORYBR|nr:pyridoxine/pyridoxamine 5'-phosphate oxidase 2 isoform X1 [Oryza brachyantha]